MHGLFRNLGEKEYPPWDCIVMEFLARIGNGDRSAGSRPVCPCFYFSFYRQNEDRTYLKQVADRSLNVYRLQQTVPAEKDTISTMTSIQLTVVTLFGSNLFSPLYKLALLCIELSHTSFHKSNAQLMQSSDTTGRSCHSSTTYLARLSSPHPYHSSLFFINNHWHAYIN